MVHNKVGRVFSMVIVSILPHAGFGPNDHREDAPHIICSTPTILMKTSQRYYGTSKRHMTFTLLLINSLSQIFYLMSAMPSEGLNAKNIATMMLVTFQTCHQHKLSPNTANNVDVAKNNFHCTGLLRATSMLVTDVGDQMCW